MATPAPRIAKSQTLLHPKMPMAAPRTRGIKAPKPKSMVVSAGLSLICADLAFNELGGGGGTPWASTFHHGSPPSDWAHMSSGVGEQWSYSVPGLGTVVKEVSGLKLTTRFKIKMLGTDFLEGYIEDGEKYPYPSGDRMKDALERQRLSQRLQNIIAAPALASTTAFALREAYIRATRFIEQYGEKMEFVRAARAIIMVHDHYNSRLLESPLITDLYLRLLTVVYIETSDEVKAAIIQAIYNIMNDPVPELDSLATNSAIVIAYDVLKTYDRSSFSEHYVKSLSPCANNSSDPFYRIAVAAWAPTESNAVKDLLVSTGGAEIETINMEEVKFALWQADYNVKVAANFY